MTANAAKKSIFEKAPANFLFETGAVDDVNGVRQKVVSGESISVHPGYRFERLDSVSSKAQMIVDVRRFSVQTAASMFLHVGQSASSADLLSAAKEIEDYILGGE